MRTAVEMPVKMSGSNFVLGRAGVPYRAWSTAELAAMIARNPVVKIQTDLGRPVRIHAERTNIATPALLARRASAAVGDAATSAATTAGNLAGAFGTGAVVGGSALAIVPILLALSGLVVLYVFRKPIGAFARGFVK